MLANGGTGSARALVAPNSAVLVSARTGKVVGDADMRDTAEVRFGAGSLWSVSSEGELTRIDPENGKVLATIGLGIVKPGGLAFGEGSVWVTDAYSPTLLRIDPAVDEVVDRFQLADERGCHGLDRWNRRRCGLRLGRSRAVQPGRLGGAPRPGDRSHPAPLPDPRRRRGLARLRRRRPLGCEQRGRRGPEDRPTDERDLVHEVSPSRLASVLHCRRRRLRMGGR